jgi:hypothetical protein
MSIFNAQNGRCLCLAVLTPAVALNHAQNHECTNTSIRQYYMIGNGYKGYCYCPVSMRTKKMVNHWFVKVD